MPSSTRSSKNPVDIEGLIGGMDAEDEEYKWRARHAAGAAEDAEAVKNLAEDWEETRKIMEANIDESTRHGYRLSQRRFIIYLHNKSKNQVGHEKFYILHEDLASELKVVEKKSGNPVEETASVLLVFALCALIALCTVSDKYSTLSISSLLLIY
jgi:hypothetical protein